MLLWNVINMPMHAFLTMINMMDKPAQAALAISILMSSIFCCIAVIFKKSNKEKALLPPGPNGLPIVGYLPFLGTNLHVEFTELARRYGPIFKLQLGNKLCVVLSSPSLVKEVCREQDAIFANRDPPIAGLAITYGGLDIALSPYGSYWRSMRKVFVREMLSGSNLDACYDLRKSEVMKTLDYVSTKVGTPVEIGDLAFQTEWNVILNMMWGKTFDVNQQSKVGAEFRVVFRKIADVVSKPNISDFFPILSCLDIQGVEKEARDLLQMAEELLDVVMKKRVKVPEDEIENAANKKDFIQILLEVDRLEDTGEVISMAQKKGILMVIFHPFRAIHTPKSSNTNYYLCCHFSNFFSPSQETEVELNFDFQQSNGLTSCTMFYESICSLYLSNAATTCALSEIQGSYQNNDILLGGTDTPATMTEWAMTSVLHHWEVMEKVQKELDDVVGVENVVEEFHLSKLHYLEAVVKEAMRLHPAVPLLVPRRPSQTCIVAGYTIPKDARVFVNAWAIQRDPELWEDPLEFKPERFLIDPKKWDYSGNNFQYVPFGSGRRICPGIPLAERMLMYILASLLHSFDWKPTRSKEADLSEKFGIVMRKCTPLIAIPTKRKQT